MTAQVRLYNDGPDDVEVAFRGKDGRVVKVLKIAAGAGTVIATSAQLSFTPIRQPTMKELAEANGVSLKEYQERTGYVPPGQYAEGDI
jgi:hypothetical protein